MRQFNRYAKTSKTDRAINTYILLHQNLLEFYKERLGGKCGDN